MNAHTEFATICDLLRLAASENPQRRVFTFLQDGENKEVCLTYGELDRRARVIARELLIRTQPGERALLLYSPGLEFITAFFGCLYAGVIAVPAYPPHPTRRDSIFERLVAIARDAGPALSLTSNELLDAAERLRLEIGLPDRLAPLATGFLNGTEAIPSTATGELPVVDRRDLAFLQYTSGSTGVPKGVMVSHENLLHNEQMIQAAFSIAPEHTIVGWLPFFHDMGLIGNLLQTIYSQAQAVLLAPAAFLQQPFRWLKAIEHYGGSCSGGPNFAYDLCVERISDEQAASLDLSSWKLAFNGAEPIRQETLKRFADKFAPSGFRHEAFYPCFGLAEATLFVSGGERDKAPRTLRIDTSRLANDEIAVLTGAHEESLQLVSSGHPWIDQQIAIVDPQTSCSLGENKVGEIWVHSPSNALGYWNRPEASEETFAARLSGEEKNTTRFMRTGDLGFFHDSELYVTGRLKDLIIIRGANHYPQDIERSVAQSHEALRIDCGVAFSVEHEGQERLVVAQEVKRTARKLSAEEQQAVFRAIRERVAEVHGLEVFAILLLRPGQIPKTSSGKLQRSACRASYLRSELQSIAEWHPRRTSLASNGEAANTEADSTFGGHGHTASEDAQKVYSSHWIRQWLIERLSTKLLLAPEEIGVDVPFAQFAIDSKEAVGLSGELEQLLSRKLPATLLYEYPTIALLADDLAAVERYSATKEVNGYASDARSVNTGEGTTAAWHEHPFEPIAIVGIGCRFPRANSPAEFWDVLCEGVDAISPASKERWGEPTGHASLRNVRYGGFIEGVELFDPQFFGIPPREAERMDPQQRIWLETVWLALADAGIAPESLDSSSTGVFVGVASEDYGRMQVDDPTLIDTYVATGSALSIIANRTSYLLNLRGPSLAVDTACSSSLMAVHLACNSLLSGESSVAIAGGVNLMLSPVITANFDHSGFMSPIGRCQAFAASADGYVRGEGAGAVVLKRLSQALHDGDEIYAVIRGSAVNQDGRSNGLTAPNPQAQEAVLRAAYARAGVIPGDVNYIEAHGTGTSLGDPIEANTLGKVLAEGRATRSRCRIGSVKTNIGHLEAAAGIAGLIKTALSLRNRQLPPSLHFIEPNPHIRFDELPLEVQTELGPWPFQDRLLLAGVSAFGFGGTNVHVVLEEVAPNTTEASVSGGSSDPEHRAELMVLSAHSDAALRQLADDVSRAVSKDISTLTLRDWCATAACHRGQREHRLAVVCDVRESLCNKLASFGSSEATESLFSGVKIDSFATGPTAGPVFVFSGQGPQRPGMGTELAEQESVFRDALERCASVIKKLAGWSLKEVLAAPEATSRLESTEFAQPAIVAIQIALVELWSSWGITPSAVIGHSIGEVTAAHAAGALTLEEAMIIAVERGRLMQRSHGTGKMLAAELQRDQAIEITSRYKGRVAIAAINGPKSVVFSGETAHIEEIAAELETSSVFCRRLQGQIAFHTPQMAHHSEEFRQRITSIPSRSPRIPYYSTVIGKRIAPTDLRLDYWLQNAEQPVLFQAAVAEASSDGYACYLEIGPHPVLSTAIAASTQQAVSNKASPPLLLASLRRDMPERETMLASLGQFFIAGIRPAFDHVYPRPWRVAPLPAFAWQRRRCWLDGKASGQGPLWQPHGMNGQTGDHPLLGRHIESAAGDGHIWEQDTDRELLVRLGHQRLLDSSIANPAVLVQMALAAASEIFPDAESLHLEQVDFRLPLFLPENGRRRVQLHLRSLSPSIASLEIYSRLNWQHDWTPHMVAEVWSIDAAENEVSPQLDHQKLKAAAVEQITRETYYSQLRSRGVEWPPELQSVEHVWRNNGHALLAVRDGESSSRKSFGPFYSSAVLDACLQSFGGAGSGDETEYNFFPSRITRLRLPRTGCSEAQMLLLSDKSAGNSSLSRSAQLYDKAGRLLGDIAGLELKQVDTTGRFTDAEQDICDWLYEMSWPVKENPHTGASLISADFLTEPTELALAIEQVNDSLIQELAKYDSLRSELQRLSVDFIIAALVELGWAPVAEEELFVDTLAERFGVLPQYHRLLDRMLTILAEEGYLRSVGEQAWEVARVPVLPESTDAKNEPWCAARIKCQMLQREVPECEAELLLLGACGEHLSRVLQGKVDPLQLIFPEGSMELAERLYQDSPFARVSNRLVREALVQTIAKLPPGRTLRILEIGAGTGGTTAHLLPLLPEEQTQYVFTDMSTHFTDKAAERFAQYPFIEYRLLDIERDPLSQNFSPQQFDLIIAANVLHATQSLSESLGHVQQLVAPQGELLLLELTAPERWLDLVFGLTEGWWRFNDSDLRTNHPLLNRESWLKLLSTTGFTTSVAVPHASGDATQAVFLAQAAAIETDQESESGPWLLVGDATDSSGSLANAMAEQLRQRGEDCIVARQGSGFARLSSNEITFASNDSAALSQLFQEIFSAEQAACRGILYLAGPAVKIEEDENAADLENLLEELIGGAVELAQQTAIGSWKQKPRLWFITRGAQGPSGLERAALVQSPLWGLGRVIAREHSEIWGGLIDLDPQEPYAQSAQNLVEEVCSTDGEDQLAWRQGTRHVARLKRVRDSTKRLPVAFRSDASYVITGGLGSLGLAIAKRLIERGARRLVVLGRSTLPPRERWSKLSIDDAAASRVAAILQLEKLGAVVHYGAVDVSNQAEVCAFLGGYRSAGWPSIRGVVHAAGVLHDEALLDLDRSKLRDTFSAKIGGAWLLERELADESLDFFVLCASAASLFGQAGQASYAAANSFLDALAHQRRSEGRAALSIDWGPLASVGLIDSDVGQRLIRRLALQGIKAIRLESVSDVVCRLLNGSVAQSLVLPVDWDHLSTFSAATASVPLLADLVSRKDHDQRSQQTESYTRRLDRETLEAQRAEDRLTAVEADLRQRLATIIGVPLKKLDVQRPLNTFGLDSLMAVQLKNDLQKDFDVDVPVVSFLQEKSLSQLATEVLDLMWGAGKSIASTAIIPLAEPRESYPLTDNQQALWVLHELLPVGAGLNCPAAMRIRNELDLEALRRAFERLAERHAQLRCTIRNTPEGLVQQPASSLNGEFFSVVDAAGWSDEMLQEQISSDADRAFDLARGPLFRVIVYRCAPGNHVLLLSIDHIIVDFWSLTVLFQELSVFYSAEKAGKPAALRPLELQFTDYAVWQRAMVAGPAGEAHWDYWKNKLGGELAVLDLLTDHPRPALQTFNSSVLRVELSPEITSRLKTLAAKSGATLYATLLAAYKTLLLRLSGQKEVIVGAVVAGRDRINLAGVVGYTINPVALRTQIAEGETFSGYLKQVRRTMLEAMTHQDFPLVQVARRLKVPRDPSRTPIFQTMFVLQKAQSEAAAGLAAYALGKDGIRVELGELHAESVSVNRNVGQFDLTLMMGESDDRLHAAWFYNADLFEPSTIQRMSEQFGRLMDAILVDPTQPLDVLPLLSETQRDELLTAWNDTTVGQPDECLHSLFEQQVERTPEAIAVRFEEQAISYKELNQRANQLARAMLAAGVQTESRVGIYLDRSVEMVVALLATLKAGAAYVPLDPSYPRERIDFMRQDAALQLVLCQERLVSEWTDAGVSVIAVDSEWPRISAFEEDNLLLCASGENAAYVIYTSGSTGRPKGAVISHRAIVNHMLWMTREYPLSAADCVFQKTPISFDASVWEFYAPLIAGAQLAIARPGGHADVAYLKSAISQYGVTTLQLVPSMLRLLLNEQALADGKSLQRVFCGGEALTSQLVESFYEQLPSAMLYNLYGPTEATIDATHWYAPSDHRQSSVPIGRPIDNTRLYILDDRLEPVPCGVAGELYIAGQCLGRGYLDRAALTAERFLPDPFASSSGERMYRTGDRARWRPDGNAECLGRTDYQVKVRGHRIELGEVEAALCEDDAVDAAAVVAHETSTGGTQLVGYVVAAGEEKIDVSALLSRLQPRLPNHMIPATIIPLEQIPLSPNGKVDRRALPAPDLGTKRQTEYVAPRTPLEETLCTSWAEVLGVPRVGVHDNFFELGGDSILGIQIISRAMQAGIRLAPQQFFQYQTVAELASVAESHVATDAVQDAIVGDAPLTPIQHAFFERKLHDPHHYNQALLLEVRESLDPAALVAALHAVTSHHDALRAVFTPQPVGTWLQTLLAIDEIDPASLLQEIDLRTVEKAEQIDALQQSLSAMQAGFELDRPPLFRAALFHTAAGERLFLVAHHLVIDGVSWRIVLEDLLTVYQQALAGQTLQLPPKSVSLQQWGKRLSEWVANEVSETELQHWRAIAALPPTSLPRDGQQEANTVADCATVRVSLTRHQTKTLLQETSKAYRTQINDLLLAALLQTCTDWSGQRELTLHLEGHGREGLSEAIDLSRTVGWFTSLFPVQLTLPDGNGPSDVIKAVKEQLRQIPSRGLSFGALRYLHPDPAVRETLAAQPDPELIFNYLGQTDQAIPLGAPLASASESSGSPHSLRAQRQHAIEINGAVHGGKLELVWIYSRRLHQRETIERLADTYLDALMLLINHCSEAEAGGFTPSDFPRARLDQARLDNLIAKIKPARSDLE